MSGFKEGIGMTSQRARDRLVVTLKEMGIRSHTVLEVIRTTPRHLFVDEALASRAYDNTALPIGHSQTISQPYIVARMVEAVLQNSPMQRVLEIGTGCGYQSAILSNFSTQVYTMERIEGLLDIARKHFTDLGIRNIRMRYSDGNLGWEKYAPYDAIVVSAAPIGIPDSLCNQLAENGRMVIPVGEGKSQQLQLITKRKNGIEEETLDTVSFVPMLMGLHQ